MLQVPGVRHDPQHEDLQGIQQAAVLRGVSTKATIVSEWGIRDGKGRGGSKAHRLSTFVAE